jgi:AraC-like DNA-binding protein
MVAASSVMMDGADVMMNRASKGGSQMDNLGVSISMVYPIMKAVVHKGYTTEQFFDYASFDARLLQDQEARISGAELERLTYAAAAFTQDEHFGLNQGKLTDVADMGILGYVMMHAGTIAEALQAYQRYNVILCSGFNLDWIAEGDEVLLRFLAQNPSMRMSRHCMEDMASSVYHMIQRLSNKRVPLVALQFQHEASAAARLEAYGEAFGLVPRFGGDATWMRMGKEVLEYPILYSDPRLQTMFEKIAAEIKAKLIQGSDFASQVFQWMLKRLPSALPTLQETAAAFMLSTRSLQARLHEENTSYNELAIRVRKETAMSYLGQQQYSIGDIAYLLHYSEPSVFQSAFKKWTGVTPGQFRHQANQARAL